MAIALKTREGSCLRYERRGKYLLDDERDVNSLEDERNARNEKVAGALIRRTHEP